MVKTNSKVSISTKITLYASLLSILVLFLTPIFFIDMLSNGLKTVWGFTAILGLQTDYDFNWYIYIACLILLIIGVTTYYIGPKARGYYIFSAIVYVVLAVVIFNSRAWFINGSMHFENTAVATNGAHLGVGPWFSGIATCVCAIACLVDFKTYKLR